MMNPTKTITTPQLESLHELSGQLHDVNYVLDILEQHLIDQATDETSPDSTAIGVVRTVVSRIRAVALELEGLHLEVRKSGASV